MANVPHPTQLSALVGCAVRDGGVIACEEVTARLRAAERDARALGIDTSTQRGHAERISTQHVFEALGRTP